MTRRARVERKTKESDIVVEIELDETQSRNTEKSRSEKIPGQKSHPEKSRQKSDQKPDRENGLKHPPFSGT